jgi:hypothetical protein
MLIGALVWLLSSKDKYQTHRKASSSTACHSTSLVTSKPCLRPANDIWRFPVDAYHMHPRYL